jgi:hypothetical protein
MTNRSQVANTKIALLTQHGKEMLISPIFANTFNSEILHTSDFDTDTLGSFDNTIQRKLSAAQTALKKAYLACTLTDCSQGIGSEGSINSLFGIGLIDEEFLAFVDIQSNIEIVARVKQPINLGPIDATHHDELVEKLSTFDHDQYWMLKTEDGWKKGLSVSYLTAQTLEFPVYLEPDFRAMHCPQRQTVIIKAAENLVHRLGSFCPQCSKVDYAIEHAKVKYLLCEICTLPTNQIQTQHATCGHCGYHEEGINASQKGSAFYCNFCNP